MGAGRRKAYVELETGEEPAVPRRGGGRGALLVVLLLVLASAGWLALGRRGPEPDPEGLRGREGFAEDLGPGLAVRWAVPVTSSDRVTGWTPELLLVTEDRETLRAIDRRTGEERWRLRSSPGTLTSCDMPDPEGPLRCSEVTVQAWDSSFPYLRPGTPRPWNWAGLGMGVRDEGLRDPATGESLGTWSPVSGPTAMWGLARVVLDEDERVLRLEDVDGTVRWEVPVPGEELPDILVHEDLGLATVRADGHLVLDVEGRLVAELPLEDGAYWDHLFPLAGGGTARRILAAEPLVAVLDAEGEELARERGEMLRPTLDDGSAGGIVVVADGRTARVLGSDGRVLLDLPYQPEEAWVLQGSLVTRFLGQVRAHSLEDGRERWVLRMPRGTVVGTDGEVVLVEDRSEEPRLRAVSVRDGSERWTFPLPGPGSRLHALGGMLLLREGGSLMLLAEEG